MLLLILKAALILVVGHYIIRLLLRLVGKSFTKAKLDISLAKFLLKVINITLHAVIILSALNALNISTTGLLAALSAAAVGVALALKDSLSNIAGGILLLISPRFSTGDFIEENGESGTVVQVDLMHTTIRTLDNRCVSVPNGSLINSQIVNYSREENRRVDITFSIGYDNDAALAEKIILETAKAHPAVLTEPAAPFARVSNYGASAVDIASRVWCKAADYWTVYYDLLEQVRTAFDQNGISIPYDQLDVHIKER